MKQLILPPDVNEVTMQKEILTPPKTLPLTLDQASKWLEERQHRLILCIETKQNVHPQILVAFVIETLSGVILRHRSIGNTVLGLPLCQASTSRLRNFIGSSLLNAC